MLLKIIHQTDFTYSDLIHESVIELRMAPRQEQDQHRLAFHLAIGPETQVDTYFDWLGNTVHTFAVNAFHQQIRIVATSVLEIERQVVEPRQTPDRWPGTLGQVDYSFYDYLQFGGPVIDSPALRVLTEELRPVQDEPLGELTTRLLHFIDARFTYQKGVTNFASPITDILEHGRGVCQDFTHLMIGLARTLGIPARYVSGFIHRDGDRFRGYAQTHAWCELYFPSLGWLGFDPANRTMVDSNFIIVAVGRDFRDVPPNKGTWRGNARESIDVSVQSVELPAIPAALAAERYHSLEIDVYPEGGADHRLFVTQQQGQQQQELNQQQQQQQQ